MASAQGYTLTPEQARTVNQLQYHPAKLRRQTCTVVVNSTLWPVHATGNDPKDVLMPSCDKDTNASRTSKPSGHTTRASKRCRPTTRGKRCVLVDPHHRSLRCRIRRRPDQQNAGQHQQRENLPHNHDPRSGLTLRPTSSASISHDAASTMNFGQSSWADNSDEIA